MCESRPKVGRHPRLSASTICEDVFYGFAICRELGRRHSAKLKQLKGCSCSEFDAALLWLCGQSTIISAALRTTLLYPIWKVILELFLVAVAVDVRMRELFLNIFIFKRIILRMKDTVKYVLAYTCRVLFSTLSEANFL